MELLTSEDEFIGNAHSLFGDIDDRQLGKRTSPATSHPSNLAGPMTSSSVPTSVSKDGWL